MPGGLIQLVAYGAQDVYLTGDPKVTFFKKVYARYTPFVMEAIQIRLQGSMGNGNIIQAVLPRDGDLVHDMWVELTPLPGVTPAWVAERAFKSVSLTIGGQLIDKHYQTWFRLWAEVFQNESQKIKYGKLTSVGNSVTASSTVSLPLLFFFNKHYGLALPLIALQYHEVKIIFELTDNYLNYFKNNYFLLWGNYIFLDSLERKIFSSKNHEYLIEQVQHDGGDSVPAGLLTPSMRLNLQHPVKELLWCFQNPNNAEKTMWNFCIDTTSLSTDVIRSSNSAPHVYGSPVLVSSPNSSSTTFINTLTTITSTSMSSDGSTIVVSGGKTAYVYKYLNGQWNSTQLFQAGTNYGTACSISPDGTWIAVSATSSNPTVYVYKNLTLSGSINAPVGTYQFGSSLSITSNGILAVSDQGDTSSFLGKLFVYNVNTFTRVGSTIASTFSGSSLGFSVSLNSDGTVLAIGAPQSSDPNSQADIVDPTITSPTTINTGGYNYDYGIVYLIVEGGDMTIGGIPVAQGQTYYFKTVNADDPGNTLSSFYNQSSNQPLLITATSTSGVTLIYYSTGAVQVWRFGTNWTQDDPTGDLVTTGTAGSKFGNSVSINGNGSILAIGAPGPDAINDNLYYAQPACVYIFNYNGFRWNVVAKIASNLNQSTKQDGFGTSVSLNSQGNRLVIGAPTGTLSPTYVSVYDSNGSSWPNYTNSSYRFSDNNTLNIGSSVSVSNSFVIAAQKNGLNIYSFGSKTWVEEGAETLTATTGPLSSLDLNLNGQSRFFSQTGKYFNQYQPYQYHSGSPYPGIYSYSFALEPESQQPSGTCNFSRIDNTQINITLKSSMYTPCNLKLFAINYNILRIQSGMAGMAFST